MSAHPVPPMPSPLSAATLGKVRRMLVARLPPEVLNPFDRTPEREQLVCAAIAAVLEDPELELAAVPALVAAVEAAGPHSCSGDAGGPGQNRTATAEGEGFTDPWAHHLPNRPTFETERELVS